MGIGLQSGLITQDESEKFQGNSIYSFRENVLHTTHLQIMLIIWIINVDQL